MKSDFNWVALFCREILIYSYVALIVFQANSIILGMVVKEILRLNHPTIGDDNKYQSAR